MAEDQTSQHDACMQRFIALANDMKDEGIPISVVSWSLMTACGVYATYSVAGNEGGLNPSGVDKMTDAFRQNLTKLQALRKQQQEAAASQRKSASEQDGDADS
ncbi:MAG: DUF3144 domain-containing protein [Pseudomonadota bacterium]